MKRSLLIIICLYLGLTATKPQNINISGIANHYLAVTGVGTDRVTVNPTAEMGFFHPGDKVLLIQMTGTTLPALPLVLTNPSRYKQSWKSAGIHEIFQVDQVSGNQVIFTDDILRSYDAGEKIQLVRLAEGENVTVTAPVSSMPWDGNIGGIVAIIGMDSVILNANIDVSAQGFRGGIVPDEDYTGGCRKDVSYLMLDTLYFLPSQLNRSGNKGEGIITTTWPYMKGAGFAINGGGAGNGLFSGGAGGSNYRIGGDGGRQSTVCTDTLRSSWGGYSCIDLYRNNHGAIMGGGGGTGVKSATGNATNGGNGGGMVFIITGTLAVRNGSSIQAAGQSVINAASGSGGGGGAGGTVLLDVTDYSGSLSVNIRGGYGGRTTGCTGSGGGGSGGVFWHSGVSFTGLNIDTARGIPSSPVGCLQTIGSPGGEGAKLKKLLTPLNGFLFNTIRGVDTLCAGQILPHPLTGSQPKGGNGIYDFIWEQSTDSVNWVAADGISTLRTIQPPALTQSTYYRRIVNSTSPITFIGIADTSRVIKVMVYPVITNNSIFGRDTICHNLQARTLTGTIPSGGNGTYNYLWQYSTDQSAWNAGGNASSFDPGTLQQTRYFRRQVTSTQHCSSTSNSVKITVLPSITNNVFVTPDTVICENQGPGPLNAKTPANGDGIYTYLWQSRTQSGSWTTIPSSDVRRYDPGSLTDTTYFRRIVFSGNDEACKDTVPFTSIKTIIVLPHVSNNLPSTDSSRYCAGEIPLLISGTQPTGGDGTYSYQWRIATSGNWTILPGATGKDYNPDQIVETDTRFSRIVISGLYNACYDTSAAITLDVVPYINNDLILENQTICENGTPAQLDPSEASGGLGGFMYRWIQKARDSLIWRNATGTNDQISYSPGPLTVTTLFARKAISDICTHISDTVTVTVYPAIGNNIIEGGPLQYACYNSVKSLNGSQPSDGNGDYLYEWQQSSNNADWSPVAMIPEQDFRNLISGRLTSTRFFRRVVYSSPTGMECADTTSTVEVRINPLPSGDIIPSRDTLCNGESLQVRFTVSGIHPPYTVNIDGQIKSGISSTPDSISFIPANSQSFGMVSIADDSGCVADTSLFNEMAIAVVYDVPQADAGDDTGICGNTIQLQAAKSIPGSVGKWIASGAAFTNPADPHSGVTADQYGVNIFNWTETNWHCTDDDQVQVVFYEPPQTPDAGPDQLLDFVYTTQLQAITPSAGSGKWTVVSGAGIFSNDTLPGTIVNELDNSTTLQWTVQNGSCPPVSDNVEIKINPLVIPKGFTPNGDGKNDFFDPGAANAEIIRIKIFNALGILVFESENYQETDPWYGKNMNGVELPEGTYFYIADIKIAGREKEFQFRSFIEILR